MELTFEKFKKYLNEIEDNILSHRRFYRKPSEMAKSMVELLSGVTNDEYGFIHHWVYELNFGKCAAIQMIMGKDGEAVAIETVEDLWRLLNSEETSMNIKEVQQDLFTVPQGYYLAHCISGDYALGAGIAKAFDANYNMKFKLHRDFAIPEGEKFANVGRALLVDNVFNLVTKQRCFHKPTYDTLYQTLEDMREQCENFNIDKLAMPLIGCGLDQLEWDKVKDVIEDVFGDTDIEILICRL